MRPFGTYQLAQIQYYHPSLTPGFDRGIVVCLFDEFDGLDFVEIYFDPASFSPLELKQCSDPREKPRISLTISAQAFHSLENIGSVQHKRYDFQMPVWFSKEPLVLQSITGLVNLDIWFEAKTSVFPKLRELIKDTYKLNQ